MKKPSFSPRLLIDICLGPTGGASSGLGLILRPAPTLHLGQERNFTQPHLSEKSQRCSSALGDGSKRGNSGRPDLALTPLSATSWLCDCLGCLLKILHYGRAQCQLGPVSGEPLLLTS